MTKTIQYADLFSGIGGFRVAIEEVTGSMEDIASECVFSSEIKESARKTYSHNFEETPSGDIREIDAEDIPDFDILFAGFPCQAFSSAGNRDGFADTRGTLFFEIERILREKQPESFVLENVPGLITHDRESRDDDMGRTMKTILGKLNKMNYSVTWDTKDATDFGLPQARERVFIVGSKSEETDISETEYVDSNPKFDDVRETGKETLDTELASMLTENFQIEELYGMAIKDTRGGKDNIHSWDLEVRGETNKFQRKLLNELLKQRRRKKWASNKGIKWMDGMPLTADEIRSFMKSENLAYHTDNTFREKIQNIEDELKDLEEKNYLSYEHPKDLVEVEAKTGGMKTVRRPDESCEKGYDIVTGKLSFDINKILSPDGTTPTLVATDVDRLAVPDGDGLRKLTLREGLRLFGFPEWFEIPVNKNKGFDLIGNTVPVNIVVEILKAMIEQNPNIGQQTTEQ